MKYSAMISSLIAKSRTICNQSYYSIAPSKETPDYPYIVLELLDSPGPEYQTGGDIIEIFPLILRIYHRTLSECALAVTRIQVEFAHLNISNTSGTIFDSFLRASAIRLDPSRDEDGEEVWVGIVRIELFTTRPQT